MTIFQRITNREIPAKVVYEDEQVIAFHDIEPQAPVHVLVVPKRLIPRIEAAETSDATLLGTLLLTAKRIAHELGISESGYRLVINQGIDAGETIPHLHVHLMGGRKLDWPPG